MLRPINRDVELATFLKRCIAWTVVTEAELSTDSTPEAVAAAARVLIGNRDAPAAARAWRGVGNDAESLIAVQHIKACADILDTALQRLACALWFIRAYQRS